MPVPIHFQSNVSDTLRQVRLYQITFSIPGNVSRSLRRNVSRYVPLETRIAVYSFNLYRVRASQVTRGKTCQTRNRKCSWFISSLKSPCKFIQRLNFRSDLPVKSNDQGALPPITLTPGLETAGAYASREISDIKSPRLPFGEQVAVVTGAS